MSKMCIDRLWAVSLMIIGICSLVLNGFSLAGMELPVIITYMLGIAQLIALPILAFTTVRKLIVKRSDDER